MNEKIKPSQEWFKQSEYDFETAVAMFRTKRYIYTIFMCHLSIEKALKGLYVEKYKEDPPRVHDLIFLSKKINLELPLSHEDFVKILNDISVPSRYPDEIDKMLIQYDKKRTKIFLEKTKELLKWLKEKL